MERGQNCTLGARAGVAGANLLPQPRDEDDVRVEAQWQEHVCRSNLVSGVSVRVQGRGALRAQGACLWLRQAWAGASSAVVSHCNIERTKTPSGRQCPGGNHRSNRFKLVESTSHVACHTQRGTQLTGHTHSAQHFHTHGIGRTSSLRPGVRLSRRAVKIIEKRVCGVGACPTATLHTGQLTHTSQTNELLGYYTPARAHNVRPRKILHYSSIHPR